jgi:histidinol-phosphate aminotransferase
MIRPEISGLGAYSLKQYPHRIKLNQNENPFELPDAVKAEILEKLMRASWSRYPAFVPAEQIARIASFGGWRPEGILLGNGSNDLLQLLFMSVLERGKTLVISQPTFTLYKILARGLGASVEEVPMTKEFTFDVDRIVAAAKARSAEMVVLCSPNNPTGTLLGRDEVAAILEQTPGLVILDEAYVQFAPGSLTDLLEKYDRLVVLQTFSKAMGAAGLRFGYALCQPALAADLSKLKLPYSINIFTLLAVDVLIDHWPLLKGWIDTIVRERGRVLSVLKAMPEIRAYPSGANFLLFESLRRTPAEVFRGVLERGILIRDVSSYPMLKRALRVSIGTPEENDQFISALKAAI